jgi:hypothetical protein
MATVKNIRTVIALLKVPMKYPTVVFKIFLTLWIAVLTPKPIKYDKMQERH